MVESDIVLLYIRPCVWGIIHAVGLSVEIVQTPWRPFPCDIRQWKILDIAIDELSGHCLCMRRPQPYRLFVVPAGVTVVLGLCNPPHSWTGMMGPSLPGITIAHCVDSVLSCRSIRWPKPIFQDSPDV
jgi:hypothetical protein